MVMNKLARDHSWGVQLSKGPFAVSYARGTDKTTTLKPCYADKQTRWGVSYNAGKVSLGYSRLSEKQNAGSYSVTGIYDAHKKKLAL